MKLRCRFGPRYGPSYGPGYGPSYGPSYGNGLRFAGRVLCILASSALFGLAAQADGQPWGYQIGEQGEARQGNFCDDASAAVEIAQIFERFGARTGFSALSNAPSCATRVHAVKPESLLRRVEISLESGGTYVVNFIQVQAADGSRPVLVTTRELIED